MTRSTLKELIAANGSFQQSNNFASVEQEREFAAAKETLTAEAQDNWHDPAWHREQAAVISETLDWGFRNENTFADFMPTQFVGKGDIITVRERSGLKVFYTHRAGEIDESTIQDDVFELPRDTMGWHVSEFEDDVQMNYGETIAELIPLARMREDVEVNRRIFQLFAEAAPVGSASHIDATTTWDASVLNKALSEVADRPRPSNVTISRPLTIIGRRAAVDMVLDLPGYADEAREEIRKTGRLGVYRGANVRTVENWNDEDGLPYLEEDDLYVVGGYVGRFGFYGGPTTKSYVEDKVDFHHFRSRRDLGGAVYRPDMLRRISLDV